MPIGIGKTTAGRVGSVPQVNITGYHREVQKRLFFSRREQALIIEKTFKGGYGHLDMGVVVRGVYGADFVVPYGALGNVLLKNDPAAGQADLVIAASDAYKFVVGDAVTLNDDDVTAFNSTVDGIVFSGDTATITLATDIVGAFTQAENAYITHRVADPARIYLSDQYLDTGEDAEGGGALGSVVVGNAVVYTDVIPNMDADALTALNAHEDGRFYVIK